MKRVLAVLNVRRDMLHPESRASMVDAAHRWRAQFLEVRHALCRAAHPYWQKLLVHRVAGADSRVLQLDADMLVSQSCPDPFDLVPAECLGLVSVDQRGCRPSAGRRRAALLEWGARLGSDGLPADGACLNAGFLLYGSRAHRELFERAFELGRQAGFPRAGFPEQTVLSLLVRSLGAAVCWLPCEYNCVSRLRPPRAARPVRGHIEHFIGGRKLARVAGVRWRSSEDRRPCAEEQRL